VQLLPELALAALVAIGEGAQAPIFSGQALQALK
jgi:hypothetical protein